MSVLASDSAQPLSFLTFPETYKAILDNTQEGFLVRDMAGIILDCNPSAECILGISRKELIGKQLVGSGWRLIHEDGSPILPDEYPAMRTQQTLKPENNFVMGMVRPEQPITWISINTQVLQHPQSGHPIAVYSLFHDITSLKQAEAKAINWSQRLEDIIAGANLGTWEWHINTGELMINERWAAIFGYTLAELQPVGIHTWYNHTHPDDVKVIDQMIEEHFAGKRDFYDAECRMRHKDGHWVWVIDRGRVSHRDEQGKPLMMSGTHQDISARKLAESRILAHNQTLREIAFAQSHLLRKPIASLLGLTDLMQAALQTGDLNQLTRYTQLIRQTATEADTVIHQIVDKTQDL